MSTASSTPRRRLMPPEPTGWLVLDKPAGMSSARAVAQVKRLLGASKAGHAGTLDPLATGVLPIAVGEATKTMQWAMEGTKAYRFRVRWGEARDTLDAGGKVTACSSTRPSSGAIRRALPAFTGAITQIPPAYSAVHVQGRRAYALARAGAAVEPPPRRVQVHELELVDMPDADHADFHMACGKGTYVRSLARDLAKALATEGHVVTLRRTRSGRFAEADAVTVAELAAIADKGGVGAELLPLDAALAGIPVLELTEREAARARQGRRVCPEQVPCMFIREGAVVASCDGRAVAVGQWSNREFSPRRVFRNDPGMRNRSEGNS